MRKFWLAAALLLLGFTGPAMAHFGMVIPSTPVVEDQDDATVTVELSFSHPMEMVGMPLARPKSVQVIVDGTAEDIGGNMQAAKIMGHDAWKTQYTVKRPGVYAIVMEPEPYWEPAEDCFIIHYTKTYVAAFGEGEGWDEPSGLKTEIVPLTRPFGNYAGNVFQGRVVLDGKPVPHAEVEVEYYNRDGKYAAPNEYMVTQVIKADDNGVFTYGVPFAGWWGFAALNTSDEQMNHEGEAKDIELGAVLWIEFVSPALQ
jgi:cobalt/nickel transport protein